MAKSKARAAKTAAATKKTATKKAAKKPAAKPAKKPAPKVAKKPAPKADPGWVDAGKGYQLAIKGNALVARKDGKELGSVPKPIKEGDVADRLGAAIDFLEEHARSCVATVETWMLRSLATPRRVLEAVFADEAWRAALLDAWIVPLDKAGRADPAAGGFLKAVERAKGVGIVDRDGETTWIDTDQIMVPHPILLDAVDDLRAMAVELGVKQGISQLYRETFPRPAAAPADPTSIDAYAGGPFSMLSAAIGTAKGLGYRVVGGSASTRVLERGRFVEARFYLGDGDPMDSTETGDLTWLDDKQKQLAVLDVPIIAFSEGMRMASAIYAKRKTEKEDSDD
jgi:hypothetical protein